MSALFPENLETIVDTLKQRAINHPDRNYLTFLEDGEAKEHTLTYAKLDAEARKVAAFLQNKGLKKGDTVITILPNSVEFFAIFMGCLYAGVLCVPVHEPAGKKHLKAYLETFVPTLKVSAPKMLIASNALVVFLNTALPPEMSAMFSDVAIYSDQEVLTDSGNKYQEVALSGSDTAYLQFTSGSTGTPKGIMIGHSNIMANMTEARKGLGWAEEKGTCIWLPLFHDFGLAAGMLGALFSGGYVVLMTPVHFILKPMRWIHALSKYKCSYSFAPPFGYEMSVAKAKPEELKELDLSNMISMVNGAEPVHYKSAQAFNDTFAVCGLKPNVVRPGFGMAETVIMFSASKKVEALCVNRAVFEIEGKVELIDESVEPDQKKYLVNLGEQMDNHEIAIVNENLEKLPDGNRGQILISGPSVCQGYYKNPEATAEVFRLKIKGDDKTYLTTGDLGLKIEGNFYFAGRTKDLIIIRGRNYYPQDIEHVLGEIKEVRAGCVVAFAQIKDDAPETLTVGIELRADMLKDMDMFKDYILPAVDKKVLKEVNSHFQIKVNRRIYLVPGTLAKTSSGKIKHHKNTLLLSKDEFEGKIIEINEKPSNADTGIGGDSLTETIKKLYEQFVKIEPQMDVPVVEMGGDSLDYMNFLDELERRFKGFEIESVDENTTISRLIEIIEEL